VDYVTALAAEVKAIPATTHHAERQRDHAQENRNCSTWRAVNRPGFASRPRTGPYAFTYDPA
jgi:hypothetical protein